MLDMVVLLEEAVLTVESGTTMKAVACLLEAAVALLEQLLLVVAAMSVWK